ncbi:MAG: DUF3995 domain-containing protein [Flavobacteriaceae bacterium]|nr:DUF3995 domain-containing protein [Flavobacteriaceae bacterium]
MITTILSIILLVLFTSLGLIHFYWLFGGKWGLKNVIPTKSQKDDFHPPPKFATLVVAIVLLFFGLIYFIKSGFIEIKAPNWIVNYVYWIISSIFVLRAIGEFKYIGFFKKVNNTAFAKADSKWFSPLCLTIGIIGFLIEVMSY